MPNRYLLGSILYALCRCFIPCKTSFTNRVVFDISCLFFRSVGLTAKKNAQSDLQSPSGTLRGPSRRAKSIHFSLQGRSKAAKMNFWDAPGRARASPGRLRGASGSRVGPKGRPEASREPFWSHFGAILEPFWNHFGFHF